MLTSGQILPTNQIVIPVSAGRLALVGAKAALVGSQPLCSIRRRSSNLRGHVDRRAGGSK
jgi:hypothetical protein